MSKTTLYIDQETLFDVKQLARAKGTNQSSIIREAVSQYLVRHQRPLAKGIGAYQSGRSDISERIEELLDERPRPGEE